MNKNIKMFFCESCQTKMRMTDRSRHFKSKKHQLNSTIRNYQKPLKNVDQVDQDNQVDNFPWENKTGGDLQSSKITSTLLKPFTYEKYPGERHLFKHNYTGPGTRLDLRLDENNVPKLGEEPINKVDEAALKHDLAYKSENLRDRHKADIDLIHDLNNIKNPSTSEKIQRALVKLAMKGKIMFGGATGGNLPRIVKNIANEKIIEQAKIDHKENKIIEPTKEENKLANELHKDFRNNRKYLKVKVSDKDEIWSADLVFIPNKSTEGFKIILTVIDLYTRFAFARCLENKTGFSIVEAFESIFEETQRIPKYLWVDKGTEFYNKVFKDFLKDNEIKMYSTENEGKAVVVERLNRTLKNKMWKYFTAVGNQKWNNDLVQKLVNEYNINKHSSINISPFEASKNPKLIKDYKIEKISKPKFKTKFNIGDRVRIFKFKYKFEKGYTAKWTKEIFIINKIYFSDPITYGLIDLNNEEILGRFYQHELQRTGF